jgi:lysozyme family protein
MPVETAEIDRLRQLTRAQLEEISRDFMQPLPVQRAARALLHDLARDRLIAAVCSFDDALPVFVDLTKKLRAITEEARKDPVGDAVSQLTLTLRRFGEVLDKVDDVQHEPPAKTATSDEPLPPEPAAEPSATPEPTATPGPAAAAPPAAAPAPAPPAQPAARAPAPAAPAGAPPAAAAPPPGSAVNATRFAELAAEYAATFAAATLAAERAGAVEHARRKIVGFASEYRAVAQATRVPWHVVGLIHLMESSCNFGTHLHNGDSLAHRTARVPAGRPTSDVADPPFAWSTSAVDALTQGNHKLHLVADWSRERELYELERYNGFGYRRRGLATPYLWSGSDRYVKGKFVRDGVFDPDAVSAQIGAGTIMKAMLAAGDI